VTEDPRLAAEAELLALLLQGRPDQVTSVLLAAEPAEARAAAGGMANTLAALALGLPPAALPGGAEGSDPLKARIEATLAGREKRRAAVLVIDMLNDHLTPGGPVEVPRARDIVPALAARLDAARAAGLPVVYVMDEHEPDDPDLDLWTTHNVKGTPGAEVWPALAPKPGDRRVTKPTYSAFTGSSLEAVLDELAVDTLVLTGCLTEMGLLATGLDALERGFVVEVPPDSQAGSGQQAEVAAMATLAVMPPYVPARRSRLARVRAALRV